MRFRASMIPFLILSCNYLHGQDIRLNKSYRLTCHNCYEPNPNPAIDITDVLKFTTSIELDIWDRDNWLSFKWKGLTGDWYVRHSPIDKGNKNCCGGSLKDCLNSIYKWSQVNPNHELITIFIDKKENWSEKDESRKPSDLDALLNSIFREETIYKPSQLLGQFSTLKDAALNDNWPNMNMLRGKFLFVITNGTELLGRNVLDEYLSQQRSTASCFVAPTISGISEIKSPPKFSATNKESVVIYNLQYNDNLPLNELSSDNYLSRVFNCPLAGEELKKILNQKINYLATDNYRP